MLASSNQVCMYLGVAFTVMHATWLHMRPSLPHNIDLIPSCMNIQVNNSRAI